MIGLLCQATNHKQTCARNTNKACLAMKPTSTFDFGHREWKLLEPIQYYKWHLIFVNFITNPKRSCLGCLWVGFLLLSQIHLKNKIKPPFDFEPAILVFAVFNNWNLGNELNNVAKKSSGTYCSNYNRSV